MNTNSPFIFQMLIGLPGAGKSTYSQHLAQFPDIEILSPDSIRRELTGDINNQSQNALIFNEIVPTRMKEIRERNHHVIFDATSYNRRARYSIIRLAKKLNYCVKAHVFHVSLEECIRRNEVRDKKVPVEVILRMHKNWEEPSLDEGINEIYEVPLDWREKVLDKTNQVL